jgi:hypothetical protein
MGSILGMTRLAALDGVDIDCCGDETTTFETSDFVSGKSAGNGNLPILSSSCSRERMTIESCGGMFPKYLAVFTTNSRRDLWLIKNQRLRQAPRYRRQEL